MGAWQYSIAPDASEQNIDWKRFIGNAPNIPFDPVKLFRWRNYKDYSTGVSGDLFVHLFSGLHFIIGAVGPDRVMSTGGLRFWKDGRDEPDVVLGLYDYAQTKNHPAFNLMLRTNFVDGSGGSSGFRFVGSEGVMTIGGKSITIKKSKREGPGYAIQSFPKDLQDRYIKEFKEKYPEKRKEMVEPDLYEYKMPDGYNDMEDHIANFFDAVRNGKKVVEDATFGYRAAAPAVMTHLGYYNGQTYHWNPNEMKLVSK
jgi:predicted dehydrogenase